MSNSSSRSPKTSRGKVICQTTTAIWVSYLGSTNKLIINKNRVLLKTLTKIIAWSYIKNHFVSFKKFYFSFKYGSSKSTKTSKSSVIYQTTTVIWA